SPGPNADPRPFDWAGVVALPDGRIWGRNGPDILVVENGQIVRRTAAPAESFDGVRPGFYLDRRGRLWIPNRKLNLVEKGTMQVFSEPLEQVTAIFEDRQSTLWFG